MPTRLASAPCLVLSAALALGCAHPAAAVPRGGKAPERLYAYPAAGQSPLRQDRDRYECYRWARRQTGFDPGLHAAPRRERARVVSTRPPGADTLAGAATGAFLGAISTHDHGKGAAIGAAIGAAVGAVSDVHRERTRRALEADLAAPPVPRQDQRAYQRAMGACLEGRGYSVR